MMKKTMQYGFMKRYRFGFHGIMLVLMASILPYQCVMGGPVSGTQQTNVLKRMEITIPDDYLAEYKTDKPILFFNPGTKMIEDWKDAFEKDGVKIVDYNVVTGQEEVSFTTANESLMGVIQADDTSSLSADMTAMLDGTSIAISVSEPYPAGQYGIVTSVWATTYGDIASRWDKSTTGKVLGDIKCIVDSNSKWKNNVSNYFGGHSNLWPRLKIENATGKQLYINDKSVNAGGSFTVSGNGNPLVGFRKNGEIKRYSYRQNGCAECAESATGNLELKWDSGEVVEKITVVPSLKAMPRVTVQKWKHKPTAAMVNREDVLRDNSWFELPAHSSSEVTFKFDGYNDLIRTVDTGHRGESIELDEAEYMPKVQPWPKLTISNKGETDITVTVSVDGGDEITRRTKIGKGENVTIELDVVAAMKNLSEDKASLKIVAKSDGQSEEQTIEMKRGTCKEVSLSFAFTTRNLPDDQFCMDLILQIINRYKEKDEVENKKKEDKENYMKRVREFFNDTKALEKARLYYKALGEKDSMDKAIEYVFEHGKVKDDSWKGIDKGKVKDWLLEEWKEKNKRK